MTNLEIEMINHNLTAQKLARLVGVSRTAVHYWLKLGSIPRPDTARKVSKILNKPVQYLFYDTPEISS